MIVNCPKCSTKLSLDDSLVKGKKVKVRCAVCQDIFSAGPLPDPSLGMGADMDLDLNLDLSELGDLEAGLEDALSEAPEERLSPLADSGDLDLNLPNLDDLEEGLESAMSSPGGEPKPLESQAARPPEPPIIDDEDTLGELGDLSDEDLDLAADGQPAAKPADDMGELPDLAAEIADDLGDSPSQELLTDKDEDTLGDLGDLADEDLALAADEDSAAKPADDFGELPDLAAEIADDLEDAPSQEFLTDKDEDTLGDLGDLADEDLALAADEDSAAKPADDMGELPGLAAEMDDDFGDFALDKEKDEDTLDLDLDLDLPGVEDVAPPAAAAPADEDEDADAVARALAEVAGPDAGEEVDLSEPVTKQDLTMGLGDLEATEEEEPLAAGDGELDLDLDMDLGAEGAAPGDLDLDLDLGDMEDGQQPEQVATGGEDLDLGDLDLGDDAELDLGATQEAAPRSDGLGALDTDFDMETPAIEGTGADEQDLAIDLDSFELTSDDVGGMVADQDFEQIPDYDKPVMDVDFDLEETMEMGPGVAAQQQTAAQETTEVSAPPGRDMQETVALDRPFVDEQEQSVPLQEDGLWPDQKTQESFAPEEEAFMPPPEAPARNWAAIGAVIVLVLAVVGAGGYFASKFLGQDEPVAIMAPADDMGIRNLTITNVAGHLEENENAGQIVVLRGTIKNEYPQTRNNIQVYAELFDGQNNVVAEEWAAAGIYIANQEFRSQPMQELVDRFTGQLDSAPVSVMPGEEVYFTVIFFNPPQNVSEYSVQPIGSSPAGI